MKSRHAMPGGPRVGPALLVALRPAWRAGVLGMLFATPAILPGRAAAPDETNYGTDRSQGFNLSWQQIAAQRGPVEERRVAQAKLLQDWAAIDLAGALAAVASEKPDTRLFLAGAFQSAFKAHPQEAWAAIAEDGALGAETAAALRTVWEKQLLQSDHDLLMATMKDFPPELEQQTIEDLSRQPLQPGEYWHLLGLLAAGDDRAQAERRLRETLSQQRTAGENEVPEDLKELARGWQGAPDGPARRLGIVAWSHQLARSGRKDFARAWKSLPAAERTEALRVALDNFSRESPAITDLLDQAVAAGQWAYLRDHGAEKMSHEADFASDVDLHALANWARTLPPRPETVSLYRAAVDGWLADEAASLKWLKQMPMGEWHREQGFAALAQNALNVANEDLLAKAIAEITEPELKKEAQRNWDGARGR